MWVVFDERHNHINGSCKKNRELCEGKTIWCCDMLKSTAMKIDAILHSSLDLCERRLDTC